MIKAYKLYVAHEGKGRPVILLHGGFTTHVYWRQVCDLLEEKCELFEPDLLGFGKSPKPRRGGYDIDRHLECLEKTFEGTQFDEKPILVGHSIGAVIAAHWAAKSPEKFSAVVLSAPVFFDEVKFHQQLAAVLLDSEKLPGKRKSQVVVRAMTHAGKVPKTVAKRSKKWPEHIAVDLTSHKARVIRKLMKSKHFADKVMADIAQNQLPMHIFVGERDMASFPALGQLQDACKTNGKCKIHLVPAGHQIPLEHPEKIAQAILSV